MASIRPRERSAIIQSLRAGVTPRVGLEYIQVGRVNEVKALNQDLDNIAEAIIDIVINSSENNTTNVTNVITSNLDMKTNDSNEIIW